MHGHIKIREVKCKFDVGNVSAGMLGVESKGGVFLKKKSNLILCFVHEACSEHEHAFLLHQLASSINMPSIKESDI